MQHQHWENYKHTWQNCLRNRANIISKNKHHLQCGETMHPILPAMPCCCFLSPLTLKTSYSRNKICMFGKGNRNRLGLNLIIRLCTACLTCVCTQPASSLRLLLSFWSRPLAARLSRTWPFIQTLFKICTSLVQPWATQFILKIRKVHCTIIFCRTYIQNGQICNLRPLFQTVDGNIFIIWHTKRKCDYQFWEWYLFLSSTS